MTRKHRQPSREHVFVVSLLYHGFRYVRRVKKLKRQYGYVMPATDKEDSGGIDFWIKMPKADQLVPIQVTQRGIRLYRKHHEPSPEKLKDFIAQSNRRIRNKQRLCRQHHIAFVLVRDYDSSAPSSVIAWGDVKALRYAIKQLMRQ